MGPGTINRLLFLVLNFVIIIIIIVIVIIDRLVGLEESACLTADHEVAGSIPSTSTNFKLGLGLERDQPSLARTIG